MKTNYELAREFIKGYENEDALAVFDEKYNEDSRLDYMVGFIKENVIKEMEHLQIDENASFTTTFYVAVSNNIMLEFMYFEDTLHPWAEESVITELTSERLEFEQARCLQAEEHRENIEKHTYGWDRNHPIIKDFYMNQQRAYILGKYEFPTE